MSKRKVIIGPQFNFEFQENRIFQDQWSFLHDEDRQKIIAAQLTYLDFHGWLYKNLRTKKDGNDKPETLFGDISEGFIRTDILLYAAICESALHDVAEWVYKRDERKALRKVRECFRQVTSSPPPDIENVPFLLQEPEISGQLTIHWEANESQEQVANPSLERLVKAGFAIGLLDEHLRERLHRLRRDRNTIHLAERINRKKNDKYRFTPDDRNRARDVVEELRQKIAAWYQANCDET